MTNKTKINQHRSDRISSLLDPKSDNFDFEFWAEKVGQQMKSVLKKRWKDYQEKKKSSDNL